MVQNEHSFNYDRIAKAISYILDHQQNQPNLDEIAAHICLSPFHFQRLFQEWVGTTPKKFLQFISLDQAKKILSNNKSSILSTSQELGLSSSSRLHEMFVKIEAMTPAEYKNQGQALTIWYSVQSSPFGPLIIASTAKGICQISFLEDNQDGLSILQKQFQKATYIQNSEQIHIDVLNIFNNSSSIKKPIHTHIKGTDFQLKVWEALLKIPFGNLQTYGHIAETINKPTASRAVGTAIGSNPLAYLIPCHRVIQATGLFGGYMWNPIRKTAIIGWEGVSNKVDKNETT